MKKEQLIILFKKAGGYILFVSIVILSFFVGRISSDLSSEEVVKVENPYSHAFDKEEISIAVNEDGELMLVDKKTGKYNLYSDSIGLSIFHMYANKIYSTSKEQK